MKKYAPNIFSVFVIIAFTTSLNAQKIEIIGDGSSERELTIQNEQITTNAHTYITLINASEQFSTAPNFDARKSRGTLAMPTDVMEGDRTLALLSGQYIDGAYRYSTAIEMWTGPEPSSFGYPSFMTFSTTSPGETSREERMRVDGFGRLGIATDQPKSKLHIADGDVYIENISSGVIIKSPNGNCWRYAPDNSGTLIGTSINCPN